MISRSNCSLGVWSITSRPTTTDTMHQVERRAAGPALPFRLQIRATDKIEHNRRTLASKVVFAHLQVGQFQRLSGACRVWGQPVDPFH